MGGGVASSYVFVELLVLAFVRSLFLSFSFLLFSLFAALSGRANLLAPTARNQKVGSL
jgi:hypothetical protein